LIIIGNHRDAWTFGAADPNSGTVVLLEIARAFGKLLKEGFKPSRTIIFATWDAEEFGIIGSTEWVEHNKDLLKGKTALYLNVDTGVTGSNFSASATPSLRNFIREITKSTGDPASGLTVYDAWRKNQRIDEKNKSKKESEKEDTQVGILGSGSDFAAFYNFLGIASLNWSFGGKSGVYHSQYDNFYFMSTFSDPGFIYHPVMVKLTGTAMLRLANCSLLPFDYYSYAIEIEEYFNNLEKHSKQIDLGNVREKVVQWEELTKIMNQRIENEIKNKSLPDNQITIINKKLCDIEKAFVNNDGLPGREWYKHTIYASDKNSGYGALTLPGLREALDEGNMEKAKNQLYILTTVLVRVNKITGEITDMLKGERN